MKKYYIHNGMTQSGPYTMEELQRKNIDAETYIWYEGLSGWKKAFSLAEIKALFSNDGLPPPYESAPPPFFEPVRETSIVYEDEVIKRKKVLFSTIAASVLLAVAGIGVSLFMKTSEQAEPAGDRKHIEKAIAPAEREKQQPARYLTVTGRFHGNLAGTRIRVKGMISNKATEITYRDPEISIFFYNREGQEIGNNTHTIHGTFAPGKSDNFDLRTTHYRNADSISFTVLQAHAE